MKPSAISICFVLAGVAGVALAAGQAKVMPPITAQALSVAGCTPPNDTTGHACDAFNQLIRANFSAREIGELFGYASNYPESRTGGLERLQRRYQAVVQEYVAAQQMARKGSVAAK
ncbi:MAG TPA: hypothetical protein VJ862_05290 [Rhodanobacteraceae bacterium]|nr:hypothetical protein [Rhodanobacteraceae bacterium]